jgi:hypothetical protein
MRNAFILSALFAIAALPPALAQTDAASQPKLLTSGTETACAWTGKELLVWSGKRHAHAFEPKKNTWRAITATLPQDRIATQGLLRLSDGTILAAYWAIGKKTQLCFDRCWPETGAWRRIAAVGREEFKDKEGKPYEDQDSEDMVSGHRRVYFPLEVSGMVAMGDGAVAFVVANMHGSPPMGISLSADGRARLISRDGALWCSSHREDTAVYALDEKILYFSYADVDRNMWSVWDAKTDTWSKPKECDRRYAFSHCQIGNEVYVFGGAESSAFGWIKSDGAIYSFQDAQWRPLPTKDSPSGRRDGVMCSTGKKVLLWGGHQLGGGFIGERERVLPRTALNEVVAFYPADQQWQALPSRDAPSARWKCSSVWTGNEMIVWGGRFGFGPTCTSGYAYNPESGQWRRLPDLPKETE